MLGFWDREWAIRVMLIHDYFKAREEQRKKWEAFCHECTDEIMDECMNIVNVLIEGAEKQAGKRVHKDLLDGATQLPLYAFYLVLCDQGTIAKEQGRFLQIYFTHSNIPYTMNLFLEATRNNNYVREDLINLVGITEDKAGSFWVQFFKMLYRTDEDTSHASALVSSFCQIMTRFSALNGEPETRLLVVMKKLFEAVDAQAVLCRQLPADSVDFFGDTSFVEHFNTYKENLYKVCRMTMEEDAENLTPDNFFKAFTLGNIYQVISRCTRNRADKVKMVDDVLAQIDIDTVADGAYIFKYMEDEPKDQTSMLAYMMYAFTDLEDSKAAGWNMICHGNSAYNEANHSDIFVIKDATNFLIGMENYLSDKYPMSGFGDIASKYAKKVSEIILKETGENVGLVDEKSNSVNDGLAADDSFVKTSQKEQNNYKSNCVLETVNHTHDEKSQEIRVNNTKNEKIKFFKCHSCGKTFPLKEFNDHCPECYEYIDTSEITDHDIIYPVLQEKYYDIALPDGMRYMKICYLSNSNGFILHSYVIDEEFKEDSYAQKFEVHGREISVEDEYLGEIYKKDGEYLYETRTMYAGTVPDEQYFNGFFQFNAAVKPIRFMKDGTVQMMDQDIVTDTGRYLREGELIRTDITNKEGKLNKSLWLVVNGRLCRDAYVSEKGLDAAIKLLNKEMPQKRPPFFRRLFGA